MAIIEIPDEDLKFLQEMAKEMATQDRMATADPYYYTVRTFRMQMLPKGIGDRPVWYPSELDWASIHSFEEYRDRMLSGGYAKDEADAQEKFDELQEFSESETEEYHNVFLTEKGWRKHMELNGHNYSSSTSKPGYFIKHAYRNPEMSTLIKIIKRFANDDSVQA